MPLVDDSNDPAVIDAFGVRFTMTDRGKCVRCHVFKAAIDAVNPETEDLLSRFKKNRGVFARIASGLYDAGHQNPWIDAVMVGPSFDAWEIVCVHCRGLSPRLELARTDLRPCPPAPMRGSAGNLS